MTWTAASTPARAWTFWLRPAFWLRVVTCFQRLAGFERAMALASTALTASIALAVLFGPIASRIGQVDVAERTIARYSLSGEGADAVRQLFSAPDDTSTSILAALFLVVSVLSFGRIAQRFFEQVWELKPLSVLNTLNVLVWAAALAVYLGVAGWIRVTAGDWAPLGIAASVLVAPLSAGFLVLSGTLLTDHRVPPRRLLPFAAVAAVAEAAYAVAAAAYLPQHFSSSAAQYGPVGAVFAMISTLFVVMVMLVAAGAIGRETADEIHRIRTGHTPPAGETRKEWQAFLAQARLRWDTTRHPDNNHP